MRADTVSAWQDSMAAFALRGLPQDGPGVRQAAQLLRWGRRESTWANYDSKLLKWFHFCTVVWPAAGHAPLRPFPAEPAHILAYLGYLCEQDRVHASSLQPYLSAINSFHADLGHPKPAIGSLVHLARRGFGELEGEMDPDRSRRGPLPARVALQIVRFGLQSLSAHEVRVCACVGLQFAFFARSDTGINARCDDLLLDKHGLHWRERTKTLPRLTPATLSCPWPSSHAWLHRLLARYLRLRGGTTPDAPLWRMQTDAFSPRKWRPALIDEWLHEALSWVDATPPPGVLWSSHSLRSGGATAALAIGVDPFTIARWGIWAAITSVQPYIDPLVPGDDAALFFFRHLLKRVPLTLEAVE